MELSALDSHVLEAFKTVEVVRARANDDDRIFRTVLSIEREAASYGCSVTQFAPPAAAVPPLRLSTASAAPFLKIETLPQRFTCRDKSLR